MEGRLAGWLWEELIDEPLADAEAETTICILQLILCITLNSIINENSRYQKTKELEALTTEDRAPDILKEANDIPHLFAPVTKINRWPELAAHGGRPIMHTASIRISMRVSIAKMKNGLLSSKYLLLRNIYFPIDQSRSFGLSTHPISTIPY